MALLSRAYGFTGDWQRFPIPKNVHNVYIIASGGSSGARPGGGIVGELRVKDDDVLHIAVGRAGFGATGRNGGDQCWPNGGAGGAGGAPDRAGGDGGGGATAIRLNAIDGAVVAVAGGAGGTSGDGGNGGIGYVNGEHGYRADSSANYATGGTQTKGGNGGHVGSNANFDGTNAPDGVLARGGDGGHASNDKAIGGGGGGGGYHSGGGGQAGKAGAWYGSGGGGGSNFTDALHNVTYNSYSSGMGHGSVIIAWYEGGDLPPATPSDVLINGDPEEAEMLIHGKSVTISAKPTDSTTDQDVRILVQLSPKYGDADPFAAGSTLIEYMGTWDPSGQRDVVAIDWLQQNTLYHGRVYSQDHRGQRSAGYVGISFWTNRPPDPPVITSPAADTQFESTDSITMTWTNSDPDADGSHPETPIGWAFRWRVAATAFTPAGPWNLSFGTGALTTVTLPATTFTIATTIEWQVLSQDPHALWSDWSESGSFYITAVAVPPIPYFPSAGSAQYTSEAVQFAWQFRTLIANERQTNADLRWRLVGQDDSFWQTIFGDLVTPGSGPKLVVAAETFPENQPIEWQVRTHTTTGTVSDWSVSDYFWSIPPPGLQSDPIPLDWTRTKEVLGEGVNRVYLYKRGGLAYLGELTPLADVQWSRKRDDMGACTIHINKWSDETIGLLMSIASWKTELVVFRTTPAGTERVFEGPVVRITDSAKGLEVEAKDVMGYVYRRLLRLGYNDSYQCQVKDSYGNCLDQLGLHTVVYRAERIIANALAYDDPNVLPYLTSLHNAGDALQARIVKAYTKSAWEDIDDMAANSGLDYVTVGRRIILNDVHRPVGRLPEMTNGHFSTDPVITEYGMSYATDFAVTNNNGLYGLATRGRDLSAIPPSETLTGDAADTGHVEQIASQYGESDAAGAGTDGLTPAEIAALQEVLSAQAQRNIAARYPMPRVVRVPDNATLMPDCPVGINQLVPGVWIPLRAKGLILQASQWQKLDALTVRQDEKGEKVSVVLSPAPNGGIDPDALDLGEGA